MRLLAISVVSFLSVGILLASGCGGSSTGLTDSTTGASGDGGSLFLGDLGGSAGSTVSGSSVGPSGGSTSTDGNTYTNNGCINGNTQCTDCIDNDGDGLIDSEDPECSGPLDNDEGSFATGIPGDNIDFCQDCFFDGNSGHDEGDGDDGCQYNTECLYGREPRGPAQAACFSCDVSATCVERCGKYTPNGCDCFGCCQVFDADGVVHTVLLEESCTLDSLGDDGACTACVQNETCVNDCKPCEICIGRYAVAEECEYDEPECPEGRLACTAEVVCPDDQYCLTGCCVPLPTVK
jgi:hypothetical protein